MLILSCSLSNDSQVQKSVIFACSCSLPLQAGGVNGAVAGWEVKPLVGFLPFQKLGDSGKCSRQGTSDLRNQFRGNLSSDVSWLTILLYAGMLCGLCRSSELSEVLKM